MSEFSNQATRIHRRLFVPPLTPPITNLNVPFMVAPEYFQKHKYLLEVIPLIMGRSIAMEEEKQTELMKKDYNKPPQVVIENGKQMFDQLEESLDHFISERANSKSLSIVPLFYWYNDGGKFIRALFYGFIYWMLSGTEEEIKNRKLVFSINRDRFEKFLFDYNAEISPSLHRTIGAGLKATVRICDFFQALLTLLNENPKKTTEDLDVQITQLLVKKGLMTQPKSRTRKGRLYSEQDKTIINIREMFTNSIRCHICGGVVNLGQDLQYDHTKDFAVYRFTDPDTGKPTHPFCNNFKKMILDGRAGRSQLNLPKVNYVPETEQKPKLQQLSFFGENAFPD